MFEVEMEIGNGWENCWHYDAGENNPNGTPQTFETLDEAIDAIRDHETDSIAEMEAGNLDDNEDRSMFRIRNESDIYNWTGEGFNYELA